MREREKEKERERTRKSEREVEDSRIIVNFVLNCVCVFLSSHAWAVEVCMRLRSSTS